MFHNPEPETCESLPLLPSFSLLKTMRRERNSLFSGLRFSLELQHDLCVLEFSTFYYFRAYARS
jgi:hypothetical protein